MPISLLILSNNPDNGGGQVFTNQLSGDVGAGLWHLPIDVV